MLTRQVDKKQFKSYYLIVQTFRFIIQIIINGLYINSTYLIHI